MVTVAAVTFVGCGGSGESTGTSGEKQPTTSDPCPPDELMSDSGCIPIEPPTDESVDGEANSMAEDYIFEPSPRVVLERLLPRYIEMQIYEAVLQNAASFQSAQMVAMKNATDSAIEITKELTLTYNKLRQEQITTELLDIVGGAAALEED